MERGGSEGGWEERKGTPTQEEKAGEQPGEADMAAEGSGVTVPPAQEDGSEEQLEREQPDLDTDDPANQSPSAHSGADQASPVLRHSDHTAIVPVTPQPTYLNAAENVEHHGSLAEEEEDEEELSLLDSEHPLMKRFQSALKNHLIQQLERLKLDLREKLAMEKAEASHSEELGVELYRVQEQLARFQACLEDRHQTIERAAAEYLKAQDQLETMRSQYRKKAGHARKERIYVSQKQAEIETLTRRLLYMEEVNAGLHSDIKSMKNATRKANAEKTQAEDRKHKQDMYVKHLTKDIERLTEQIAIHEAQITAQSEETQAAKEALSEAQMETDSLAVERKQLMQQWDSSLVALRKRDEAFTAMQEALRKASQQVRSLDTEIEGFKKSITKEEELNERLTELLNRAQLDSATSKKLIGQSQVQQEALKAHYSTYLRTLQETERTLARLNMESGVHQGELSGLRRQLEKESAVRLELEGKIMAQMQQELTHDKAAKYSRRLTDKMAALKKDRISRLWQLENESAAVELESSEVSQRLDGLAHSLDVLEQEIAERNKLLDACQAKIASCVTVIERKQATINLYNKKIQQIAASTGHADLGPLEILACNLTKQLEEVAVEIKDQQQFWMRQQGELLSLTKEKQANSAAALTLQTQHTILQQRKVRTENELEAERCEQTELERHMKMLRGDMVKLNSLLSENGQLRQALEQENTLMETHFLHRLKEAERDSIEMQMRLEKTQEEKERLLNSLVEAERQIMLWEKKIQLATETRLAVDSELGQGDIRIMKAEIHRMEVRYSQLMKQQERLQRESEEAVTRRMNIALRSETQARTDKKLTTHTDLNRSLHGLRRSLHDTHKQMVECERVIRELEESQVSVSSSLVQRQQQLAELRRAHPFLVSDLLNLKDTKDRNIARLVALQSRAKYLQAVRESRYTALSTREAVEATLQRQRERVHAVGAILHCVCQELPQHQGALRRLSLALADHTQATAEALETS